MLAARIVFGFLLAYLFIELMEYWVPLAAAGFEKAPPDGPADGRQDRHMIVLTCCRDGAACIPGFIKSFRDQDYPADHFQIWVVADHCVDDSAPIARSLGARVYERHALSVVGKGNALNDVLGSCLRQEIFDALVVLDVDDRVNPDFLRQAAARMAPVPKAVSCATYAKNPEETLYTHVGAIIQRLLRLHQTGRAALGLNAILYGSHGYVLSRQALDRLDWRTTTGQIAEDMELRLRCGLRRIPVDYAPELVMMNDVTARAGEVREQRRRWNSTYLPLIPRYVGPLLGAGLQGRWGGFEDLFGLLLLPSFANLFLYLTGLLLLGVVAWFFHVLRAFTLVTAFFWFMDLAYFAVAFSILHVPLGKREMKGFLSHLGLRTLALFESLVFIRVKDWRPAPHGGD